MRILASLILSCASLSLTAQTSWTPYGIDGTGAVHGVTPHATNGNIAYARCSSAGLFKTTDAGGTWTSMLGTLPRDNYFNFYVRSIGVSPAAPSKVAVITGDAPWTSLSALWVSNDEGQSFVEKELPFGVAGSWGDPSSGETMAMDPQNANQIAFGGHQSYDYTNNVLLNNGGLYLTLDGGDSIRRLDNGALNNTWITDVKFAPNNPNLIYVSGETKVNGSTWALTESGLWRYNVGNNQITKLYSGEVWQFDFDAINTNLIIAIEKNGIAITRNNGITWEPLVRPFNYDYNTFITPHPTQSGHWYLGAWGGWTRNRLIETTDGGANYSRTVYRNGLNEGKINLPPSAQGQMSTYFGTGMNGLSFSRVSPGRAYLGDYYGLWVSNDANGTLCDTTLAEADNANWSFTWANNGLQNRGLNRLSVHPADTSRLFACMNDWGFYDTRDGANTVAFNTSVYMPFVSEIEFSKRRPQIGYMVGLAWSQGGQLYRTTNNGTTWVNHSFFFSPAECVTELEVSQYTADTLILGVYHGANMALPIYRSDDGGLSWTGWSNGLPNNELFSIWGNTTEHLLADADGQTFYIRTTNKLYRRAYTDTAWVQLPNPDGSFSQYADFIVHPTQAGKIYTVTYDNNIFTSSDHGTTWTLMASPFDAVMALAISPTGRLVALQDDNSYWEREQLLAQLDDSGSIWTPITMDGLNGTINSIQFITPTLLAAISSRNGAYLFRYPTSVNTNEVDTETTLFEVFPNPTENIVRINTEANIQLLLVCDMTGRVLIQQKGSRELNLEALPAGTYLVYAFDEQKQLLGHQKLIKQ